MILRIAVVTTLLLGTPDADACQTLPPCVALQAYSTDAEAQRALTDPATAARAVYTLARSTTAKSVEAAGRTLLDRKQALAIANAPDGMRCHLPSILRALAENPHGRAPFIALIKSEAWADAAGPDGTTLPSALLHATAAILPPPPEVTAYWKQRAGPDGGWVNVTAMALAENRSEAAIELLEALLGDPRHSVETRADWLHYSFITHRHEVPMLAMVKRLLARKPPPPLAATLGEVVFDYRQRWYGTCTGPTPPTPAQYTPDARALVRELAKQVRANKPDAGLAAAITKLLAAFDKP